MLPIRCGAIRLVCDRQPTWLARGNATHQPGHGDAPIRFASMASAMPRLSSSGEVVIETGVAEVGVGNTAVPSVVAAEVLGVPVDRIPLVFGNADLPFAPQVGGSVPSRASGAPYCRACHGLKQRTRTSACSSVLGERKD